MNGVTVGLGILIAGLGIFSIYARVKMPHLFRKLEAMKQAWGNRAGLLIHFTAYTIVPIGIGITLVVWGMRGVSIIDMASR